MLSTGIVGCGGHARTHGRVITGSDDAELVGCADVDAERARAFADEFDVPSSYGSLSALLDAESPDLLVVAAVPTAHPDLVETALDRGVDGVLCEKPMAVGGDDAAGRVRELRGRAEAADAVLFEGLMYRHHPQIQRALELVEEGRIGEVKYVHGQFSDYYDPDPENWRNDADRGGGSMGAKGCYTVDACNVFAGAAPVEAVCRETWDDEFDVEIGETGTVVYGNGVTAQFETNHRSVWREEFKVCGTEGTILIPHAIVTTDQPRRIELQLGGAYEHEPREVETIEFEPVDSYERQFANLVDCVRGEAEPAVSLADSIANYELTDALLRSTETDRVEPVGRE